MAKKTLFLGNDVAVRYTGNGTRYNVIVFRCAGNLPLIMKNGRVIPATWPHFLNLEGFFASDEVNEIYVDAFHQHLYQTPEMAEAMRAIKSVLTNSSVNVTFGLSMGAFGAIEFSKELNATFIALSPSATYSGLLPISSRSQALLDEYHYAPSNIEKGLCKECNGYVFVDCKHAVDKIHAYYIKNHTKCQILNEPFWGHSNANKLNKIIKLNDLVYQILHKTFDITSIKQKMHNAYYSNAHPRYVYFLIQTFFEKKIDKDLYTFLSEHIDINKLSHIHAAIEKLREINKLEYLKQFTQIAYEKNPKNTKTKLFIDELNAYEKFVINMDKDSQYFFEKLYLENKCSENIYLLYSINLELLGNISKAIDVLHKGISRFPNSSSLHLQLNYMKKRSMFMEYVSNSKSLYGYYTVIDKQIYKIVNPNMDKIQDAVSFKNIITGNYIRHQFGKIKSHPFENKNLYKLDSTFLIYKTKNSNFCFKCCNITLSNHFILRDKSFYKISPFNMDSKINSIEFSIFKYI